MREENNEGCGFGAFRPCGSGKPLRLGHRARRVLPGRKVLRVILVRKGLPDPQGRKAIKERPGQAANCASWSARKKSPAMKVRRWCQLFAWLLQVCCPGVAEILSPKHSRLM